MRDQERAVGNQATSALWLAAWLLLLAQPGCAETADELDAAPTPPTDTAAADSDPDEEDEGSDAPPDDTSDTADSAAPDDTAADLPPAPPPSCPDTPVAPAELDVYGGWPTLALEGTGFFRVQQVAGDWWLVTPLGNPFFSTGVNGVRAHGTAGRSGAVPYHDAILAAYGTEAGWAEVAEQRLRDWGFNTLGAWSDAETLFPARMPYTVVLAMSGSSWLEGDIPDYFAQDFEVHAAEQAERLRPLVDDPWLVGYFLDNEVRWGPDHRSNQTLFDDYLALPADSPGKVALVALLESRHGGDIAAFNAAWGASLRSFAELATTTRLSSREPGAEADRSAFLSLLAARFFSVTTAAARAVDPNHLVLGVRFVNVLTPPEVVAASGPYVDVCSVNHYELLELVHDVALDVSGGVDPRDWLERFHALSGRPILISEFGFRAADSGLPNSWPPNYPVLDTQQQRADGLEHYALASFAAPWMVGYHWFLHSDQPAEGRFDGEDNNFGLVDLADVPYAPLVERAAWLHARMYPCITALRAATPP